LKKINEQKIEFKIEKINEQKIDSSLEEDYTKIPKSPLKTISDIGFVEEKKSKI